MHAHDGLIAFLHASLHSPIAEALAIAVAVLFQEDVTTVVVGMMAADGLVPIPLAMLSLIVGTLLNDFGLYGIGRLAITHPRLHRWVEHEKRLPLRAWLNGRLIPTVMAVQFMPGLRLPTYIACGFFSLSFRRFAIAILPAVVVWSPLAFTCSYFYGEFTAKLIGVWQWPIAIVAVIGVGFAASVYWKGVIDRAGRVTRE
ncbi:MAG: VTT domain-containing protein [Rhizomicrobium sp.]|jgi:membrane protein DedA with SNARE-associated domain